MFIFNIKVNGSKIFKYFFICIIIIFVIILGITMYKVFNGADKHISKDSCCYNEEYLNISPKNYTNILKAVHDNIDLYIGKKISFNGFVYRVSDFNNNQFVLSREMLINSSTQSVIVGFLSEYNNANELKDGEWITVYGEIIKGKYHGDMPILKIHKLEIIDKPTKDEYVYPPDNAYIPTTNIL